MSKDQQEAWTVFGIYTGYAWSPDDRHIYIWANGNIMKVEVEGVNKATTIPFTCNVNQRIYDAVRFKQDLDVANFKVNVIRQAVTSPDEKWLVFSAVGYLWKKRLPDGKPERITNGSDFEFEPSFSADGKQLLYTTWNDENSGAIYKTSIDGAARPVKLTKAKGIYRTPSFFNDNKKIVFIKEGGSDALGPAHTSQPGIYIMLADGADEQFVIQRGGTPFFNTAGDRIYFETGSNNLSSCKLNGEDEKYC